MLSSVRRGTDAPLRASIVSMGWRAEDCRKLSAACPGIELNFVELGKKDVAGLSVKLVLSPLSYARVLVPDLIRGDRFLYLDIDMIVRGDVSELWRMDLDEAPAAAVFHTECKKLNAGLLLIDAKIWRDRDLGKTILDWAKTHQPKEADQAAIEAVIGSEMAEIDGSWNRLVDPVWGKYLMNGEKYLEGAALLHYITGFKPWNLGRWLLPRAYRLEWKKHERATGLPVDWAYEAKTFLWQMRVLMGHRFGN